MKSSWVFYGVGTLFALAFIIKGRMGFYPSTEGWLMALLAVGSAVFILVGWVVNKRETAAEDAKRGVQ